MLPPESAECHFYQEKLSKIIILLPKLSILVYGSKICYLWAYINLLNEYKYSFSWYRRGEGVFFKVKGGGCKKNFGEENRHFESWRGGKK
jgi:hypothetical protein